jgi:hypothetical protein
MNSVGAVRYNMEIPNESNPNESNQIFGRRGLCRPLGPAGLAAQLLGGWQVNAIVALLIGKRLVIRNGVSAVFRIEFGPADRPTGAEHESWRRWIERICDEAVL